MNKNATILIIYSTFGDGHLQVAKAIKQTFNAFGYHRIQLLDLLAEAHPYLNAVSRFAYLKSSVYCPKLYGLSYHWTNSPNQKALVNQWLQAIGQHKALSVIHRLKPDAVIQTFPFLAVPRLSHKERLGVPNFTVLTDYVLHSRWIHPGTDFYFVASEQLKKELVFAGVNENRILASGIPLRDSFDKLVDRENALRIYGLDTKKKYLLLAAGAHGVLSNVRSLIRTVLERTGFEILLVCGKNRKLQSVMKQSFAQDLRVHVFGFAEHMEELMVISSCLITKAGGITLTEASAMSLPVVVYRPLPGQEKGNADILCEQGTLLIAHDLDELAMHLVRLEEEPFRQRMSKAISRVYRHGAAQTVVAEVLRHVEEFRMDYQWQLEISGRKAIHGYR